MILACRNISKSFGTDTILSECSFNIEDHEKAAIVGINGAGKSTLLKIIIGELSADSGTVTLSKGKKIGYLAQHQELDINETIYDEMLSTKQEVIKLEESIRNIEISMNNATGSQLDSLMETYSRLNHEFELMNGYAYKSEVVGVLKGLGFNEEDFGRLVSSLSGGQKTRVALGRLLLSRPDIILLDEPTNHLDMNSISWLENYLLTYNGSVLIVSHDRYFLDRIVSKVIEIDNSTATVFNGTYSDYAVKKAVLRNMQMKEYLNQQREIKHQEEVITKLKQFNREKSIKRAESREKALNKIEVIDKPMEVNSKMHLSLDPLIVSGNDVLSVTNLSKQFGNNLLFKDISFEIKRGERIALIGNNGTGKTTILKIINNLLPADNGEIKLGANVSIGYYDQEHHVLNPDKTIFEEIQDAYPDLNNTKIRNTLAAFLFTNDDVFKYIRDLSGGEKGRVSLAKLMLSNANFLILDEPTNHLDIVSKEILENALNHYTGTVLYVSHDRYFINTTATRILDLTCHTIVNYIGNYDYYIKKHDALTEIAKTSITENVIDHDSKVNDKEISKAEWKSSKEEQAALKKKKNELKRIEERIDVIENRIKEIDELSTQPDICTNTSRLLELHNEKESISNELDELYDRWGELS